MVKLASHMQLLWRIASRSWGAVLLLATTAALAWLVMSAQAWQHAKTQNAQIAALARGEDIEVNPASASSGLVIARQLFLLGRDRQEEAQTLVDKVPADFDATSRSALLYNLANARLRLAFVEVDKRDLDKAVPLVSQAKDDYKKALRLDPASWNTRYNLDVAMRLVRDFPPVAPDEEEPEQKAKKVWTDIPGLPRGLP